MKLHIIAATALLTIACCPCRHTPAKEHAPIVGNEWRVTMLNDKSLVANNSSRYTLRFNPEGELAGEMSCNRLIGNYSCESDGSLSLNPVGTTMMLCPSDTHTQEWQQSMSTITRYELDGDKLILLNKDKIIAILSMVR